jgi:hypothetical protein
MAVMSVIFHCGGFSFFYPQQLKKSQRAHTRGRENHHNGFSPTLPTTPLSLLGITPAPATAAAAASAR